MESSVRVILAGCDADLVCDTSVPDAHAGNAAAALSAGCDVFTEKPMTATMEEALRTASLARRHGRGYTIMQNRRYLRYVRAIRDVIAAGVLGRVGIVNADFYRDPRFDGDFRREMDSPLILDMAIHHFDQARCMSGADALAVTCHEFNPSWSWYRHGAVRDLRDDRRPGVHLPRLLVRQRSHHRVAGRLADDRRARHAHLGRRERPRDRVAGRATHQDVTATYTGNIGHAGCLDEMFAARAAGRESDTSYTDNIRRHGDVPWRHRQRTPRRPHRDRRPAREPVLTKPELISPDDAP